MVKKSSIDKIAKSKGGGARTMPSAQKPETAENFPAIIKEQQLLLDIFRSTFSSTLTSGNFSTQLQEIKQALFGRDFKTAFGRADYLEVYAARWSPTRALGYASIFAGIRASLDDVISSAVTKTLRMASIGGGAAEIIAFGALIRTLDGVCGTAILIDSAPWEPIVSRLSNALTTPPPISRYASEVVKEANTAFVPASHFDTVFIQKDILALSKDELSQHLGKEPLLVTMLFTLNELYTSGGIGKTTAFLVTLTAVIPPGSLLLVVDSPGSYSETSLGRESRTYPMQWLLDLALLKSNQDALEGRSWEKLQSHNSVWFRLSKSLQHPIPLEDMRYQLHLYRATQPSSS